MNQPNNQPKPQRWAIAAAAAGCLALAGCSSPGDSTPQPTVTVTKTPHLSTAEQQQQCVDAWANAYGATTNPTQTPAACDGLSADDQANAQFDGLQKRNKENQQALQKCLDDPTCTSFPIG